MQEYSLKVSPGESGMRLDIFLADFFKKNRSGLSRNAIQNLIRSGKITLKGASALKPHYKLKTADELNITLEDKKASRLSAEDIDLKIIYQDNDLAVINKPAGLVVHPAPGNKEHTLVNALLHHFKKLSDLNPDRPGIVHRLDKGTSGILVVAKDNAAHLDLAEQFAQHSIKRVYLALVKGKMEFDENTIELPIARHPTKRKSMSVAFSPQAKYAKTYYRTLKRTDAYSLLELKPFTGRTHQLRVHLAFLGHPILGDTKYGRNNAFPRLALHAQTLGFKHPTSGKYLEFTSAPPEEFGSFLKIK